MGLGHLRGQYEWLTPTLMCYLYVAIKICDLWCLSATIKNGGQAISCQKFSSKLKKSLYTCNTPNIATVYPYCT